MIGETMAGWFSLRGNIRRQPSGSAWRRFLRLEELEARIVPSIFTPAQIRHAYGFDQITFGSQRVPGDGSGQTIAIVEAYHDPSIAADLRYFDRIFGLADPPHFTQVNQFGTTLFTSTDSFWSLETALDVEWAHAIAPRANILLVEANAATLGDLLTAVNYARYQAGVVAVSMSWGSSEFWWESSFDGYFTTPAGHVGGSGLRGGIAFVASSGDTGAGTSYPAVSPNVLAVGGTSLRVGPWSNYGNESAWADSGGGISLFEPKPGYQAGVTPGTKRSNPDVAFNSDPNTGYYVYDTVPYAGYSGWFQEGGTSVAAPIWAALIAIADQGRALNGTGSLANAPAAIYSLPAHDFHDITTGSNGYSARLGYDLVTGRGTPYAKLVVQDLATFTGARTITLLPRMAASHPSSPTRPLETGVLPKSVSWVNAVDFLPADRQDSRGALFAVSSQPYRTWLKLHQAGDEQLDERGALRTPFVMSVSTLSHFSREPTINETLGEWQFRVFDDGPEANPSPPRFPI
jgi:subtilase family serine protease